MNKQDEQIQTAFRLPKYLLKQLDVLSEIMSRRENRDDPGKRITRTEVARKALFRGVQQLEEIYGVNKKGKEEK